jgi:ABC-2 type transport system permease protein
MKFFAINIKSQMQYKISFILLAFGQCVVSFSTFLGVYFMFARFHTVEGFTFEQALLCFSAMLMAFSIAEMFGRGFDVFPRMIGNGEFDRALVRPRNLIFQIMAKNMEFSRVGRLLQAVGVICYAIPKCGVAWNLEKVSILCLMIICGGITFYSLFLVYAAFTFFTIEGLEFMNILTDGGREFGRYPFSIYGRGILRFLTFIVPLALFQYYPLLYLLDIERGALYRLSPLFGLIFFLPCHIFFRYGVRRYKSTGS